MIDSSGFLYTFGSEENGRLGYSRKLDEESKDMSLNFRPRKVVPQ